MPTPLENLDDSKQSPHETVLAGVNSIDVSPTPAQLKPDSASHLTVDNLLSMIDKHNALNTGGCVPELRQQIEALNKHPERLEAINNFVSAIKQHDATGMKLALTPFACDPQSLKELNLPLSLAVGTVTGSVEEHHITREDALYPVTGYSTGSEKYTIDVWTHDQFGPKYEPWFQFTADDTCKVA